MRVQPSAWLRAPLDDYLQGLLAVRRDAGGRGFLVAAVAVVVSWWIYVPLHELAHAFACLAAGGEVSRLEIDPIYGAAWLRRVFPFVAVGSKYAGQLTGFDTHGNDIIYFATDFAPFLLTVLIGVPLLRRSASRACSPLGRSLMFGAAIPWAFAPFVSLPGDFYEMASLAVSRMYRWFVPSFPLARWRSDDLPLLVSQLWGTADAGAVDFAGVALAALIGTALTFATYQLGVVCSRLGEH